MAWGVRPPARPSARPPPASPAARRGAARLGWAQRGDVAAEPRAGCRQRGGARPTVVSGVAAPAPRPGRASGELALQRSPVATEPPGEGSQAEVTRWLWKSLAVYLRGHRVAFARYGR